MSGVLASMIDGLLVGAVYGLAAMGLSLIWGVMDVINLTHGSMIALGMFCMYLLFAAVTINAYVLLLPTIAAGLLLGIVVYWMAVHWVVGRSMLMSLLSTFAVNMMVIGIGTAVWSTSPYNVNFVLPGITIGAYTFTGNHIAAAISAVVIALALQLFLYHTRTGKAIRAVADNRDAAELMGISSTAVLTIAFAIGIALACTSGALVSTLFPFTILSGSVYQLKSFVVTILAGLGKPFGALVAGVLLGLLEGVVTPFIAVSWIPLIEFGLFVVVLVAFPQGIFGEEGGGMILRRPFFWIILVIAGGFIYAPLHGNNVSLREDLILVAIAIILASNLNLMIGYTGYVNFGHIVFYGLGGYVGLYLTTVRGWNLVLSALVAGVVVSICAFLFGLAILRLRGAYFALATIGILQAVQAFVSNFDPWGRSTGMYLSFESYQPLGGARRALWITYFLIIAVMALSMILSLIIKNSKFGLGLFAIREDEDAAVVLGVNATMYKAIIYSVSAFLPAVAGALMFYKNGMIDPSIAFEYMLSLEGIVMLMLGGQGSVIGAALGGTLYEKLRSYLLTSPALSNFHLVIAGGLLLLVVLFAPGGLIGWVYRLLPRARKVIE